MICPFKKSEYIASQDRHIESYWAGTGCNEEECALWDEIKKQCCIKTLSELKISGGIRTFPLPK